jgi:hypothetical protein
LSGLRFQAGRARIEGRSADGWVVDGRLYRPALLLTDEAALSIPGLTLDTLEAATIPGLSGAELLLLGLQPKVEESDSDTGHWFRVYLGPYSSHTEMTRAKSLMAAQDIDSLLLKRTAP